MRTDRGRGSRTPHRLSGGLTLPGRKHLISVVLVTALAAASACTETPGPVGDATAQPSPIAVSITLRPPTPTPSPLPISVSHGETWLKGTYTFDFEAAAAGVPSQADVWWEQIDTVRRYLVPQNGALIAWLGQVDFDAITASQLRAARFTDVPIDGSNTRTNQLTAGTVVAIRTRHGQYTKMQVKTYGFDLLIKWVTYP